MWIGKGDPFWVSRICQCIDEELDSKKWCVSSVQEAVKLVTAEKNALIDDLAKNLENNESIYELMFSLLIVGKPVHFAIMNPNIELCHMYGYISCNSAGYAIVFNKIYEILMTGYFASKEETQRYLANA